MNPGKVLIIRLSSLGDVVLATSAVEALAKVFPDLKPDVLTKPEFAAVFQGNPHVGKVFTWGKTETVSNVAGRLRPEGYRFVADLHGNLRTRLLRVFLPAKWSVYSKGTIERRLAVWFGWLNLIEGAPHVTERYAGALRQLGVREPSPTRLYPSGADFEEAETILASAGWDRKSPLLAFAPLATWKTKGWPENKWRELAARAVGEYSVFPVWMGGPSEKERNTCLAISEGLPGAVLAGKTSILQSAAALKLCRAIVTNDSAPLHIANAMGTPVVAIFGPTVREFGFWPMGPGDVIIAADLACRPCRLHGGDKCPKGHFACMEEITVDEVLSAVTGMPGIK